MTFTNKSFGKSITGKFERFGPFGLQFGGGENIAGFNIGKQGDREQLFSLINEIIASDPLQKGNRKDTYERQMIIEKFIEANIIYPIKRPGAGGRGLTRGYKLTKVAEESGFKDFLNLADNESLKAFKTFVEGKQNTFKLANPQLYKANETLINSLFSPPEDKSGWNRPITSEAIGLVESFTGTTLAKGASKLEAFKALTSTDVEEKLNESIRKSNIAVLDELKKIQLEYIKTGDRPFSGDAFTKIKLPGDDKETKVTTENIKELIDYIKQQTDVTQKDSSILEKIIGGGVGSTPPPITYWNNRYVI